ncbi:hypothetical protein IW261DRAFT_1628754 [Armillaria novae-zelandiae]|uniref:C2H2-type domain-containing protein n=1 Tax=Armillaria novae-zelandiae TaxID=153914 RepID=A0AA39TSC3_9AGAR|nr:hypothetical protein IW261DRAFT_1628754 [Armillaria novae-zelandiae]
MPENISLPSIHKMFPEHLLSIPPEGSIKSTVSHSLIPANLYIPPLPLQRREQYSLDIHRSHPAHYSSLSLPYQPIASGSSLGGSRCSPPTASKDTEDDTKRFICTIHNKHFGRPSVLKIHINTHTGATPFRCPIVGCRREFNVNSNMLRHYRNHLNSTVPVLSNSPLHHYLSSPYFDQPMAPSTKYTQYDSPMKKSQQKFVWRPALLSPSFKKDEQEQGRSQFCNAVFPRGKYDDRCTEGNPRMYMHKQHHSMSDAHSTGDAYDDWETEMSGNYPYVKHSYFYV